MNKIFDKAFEQAVLSSILFSPDELDTVKQILNPVDFYFPSHRKVFQEMISLQTQDKPIDEEYLRKSLTSRDVSDDVLIEILSANPIANVNAYAKDIKNAAIGREIQKITSLITKGTSDDNLSNTKLLNDIRSEIEKIEKQTINDIIKITDIADIEEKETEYICRDFLAVPKYQVSGVAAPGGVGKTFTMAQAALCILNEDPLEKVFCWFQEDDNGKTKKRVLSIIDNIMKGSNINKYKGRFSVSDDMPIDIIEEVNKRLISTDEFTRLKLQLRDYTTIIIDPLLGMFSESENDNTYGKRLMLNFVQWAKEEKKTIIFIHHADKEAKYMRGASSIRDAMRAVYILKPIKNAEGGVIKNGCVNIVLDKDNNHIESVMNFSGTDKDTGKPMLMRKIFPSLSSIGPIDEVTYESSGDEKIEMSHDILSDRDKMDSNKFNDYEHSKFR